MNAKTKKKTKEQKYTKLQRRMLIVCAVIMVTYVVLAYFVTRGWDFVAIHTVLAAVAILYIWIGGAPKVVTYMAIFLSVVGAGTALALILFYLTILNNLATG
jgi:hypothetical protein